MKAGGAALPELDGRGDDAIAAPEGWQRDVSIGEALADFAEFCVDYVAASFFANCHLERLAVSNMSLD